LHCLGLRSQFKTDFGETPKREDLTIIAPRVDDPEDLVRPSRSAVAAQRSAKPCALGLRRLRNALYRLQACSAWL
jgi:hypothetical protein